jgi:hypothetical protein
MVPQALAKSIPANERESTLLHVRLRCFRAQQDKKQIMPTGEFVRVSLKLARNLCAHILYLHLDEQEALSGEGHLNIGSVVVSPNLTANIFGRSGQFTRTLIAEGEQSQNFRS